jgi:hypothetical protein
MAGYIAPPLVTEPADLADTAFEYLEGQVDGWLPSPGNLETWLIEAQAQLAGELMDVASAVPTSIFRYFGSSILGLPPLEATAATGATTWTVKDALGYTILAGTLVGIPAAGDVLLAFEVATDTPIPAGATTAIGVPIVAQESGDEANALTGAPQLIDALDYVVSVTLDAPTSGGADGETDDEYLNRLVELAQLSSPRPILPNDFAVLARTVPGVGRASAIDLYNPGPPITTNTPRCVTVVVADDAGEALSSTIMGQVDAYLQAQREVNFLVFVIAPTYLAVAVTFTVKVYPDYLATDVVARAKQAVTDYLTPANWGALPYGEAPTWLPDTTVRYLEVAEVINRVEGVWYIGALTVQGGTVDVALPAPSGLPRPGVITGSAL